ncbi:hypothetical protein MRB53_031800 [Persea americana]|uniref:Uncharacterized protein n=1 Tax=Persea americana TaxID=3435 RepID=A0ACC2KR04_PERAE|nr:hypothetical protein MRB53_031800 [Persea americana]
MATIPRSSYNPQRLPCDLSNFTNDDVCKAAIEVTIENATDTQHQISKMLLRGSLNPASKRGLRECEKQYDLALYNLTSTEQYLKSDAFNKTHDYNPILYVVQDAFIYVNECASLLSKEKGVGEALKQGTEMVMKLADNDSLLIMFQVV